VGRKGSERRRRHPWLRINRLLRAMLHERVEESDPACGVVQLIVTDAPADVEGDRVWMTCSCGAAINRSQDD
jgi:hypothetical protein